MTGVWVAADVITAARMNEKTIIQATGSVINGLTTYAGMLAFCTSTGSGFILDNYYKRNTANTSWSIIGVDELPYIKLSTTIGDYTYPSSGVASSNGELTSLTDSFAGWITQAEADFWYPSSNTALARVNITTDVIDHKQGTFALSRDLKVISDSAFEIRFKLTVPTVNLSGGGGQFLSIGLSSADYNTTRIQNQDSISLMLYTDNLNRPYYIQGSDGVSMGSDVTGTAFTETVTAGDIFWVKIARTSTTSVTISLYSESTFTTLVESKTLAIASTIQGLRYFVIKGTDSGYIGTVDDLNIVSGMTYDTVTFMFDNSIYSSCTTLSTATPSIYFDLTSDREIVGLALMINRALTTVTSLQIRASTDTTFTDSENIAYVNISDFTDDTWRFLANNFLADNRRYVQIYANETGVLSINEIKVRYGVTDLIKILNHRHRTRVVTAADIFTDSN